jgi:putative ABC transport system ATP-binding protein
MTQKSAIELKDLKLSYPADRAGGSFCLSLPALSVPSGERLAVIGPSGSGKTTLLNVIAGILPVDKGEVRVAGSSLSEMNDEQRRAFRISHIGMVFQRFELISYLNVLDNILHPYRINDAQRLTASVRQRAQQLAARLDVGDKLGRYPHQLSQGESQRVAVCRALITEPRIILADEPTANLDPVNKQSILDILFEESARLNLTLLVVTHDHELLQRFERVVDFATGVDA